MKRRTLLKIMLGTAPGVAVFGLQRTVWPQDQAQRPQNDPVSIGIDDSGHLYDPGHDQGAAYPQGFLWHRRYDPSRAL